MYSPHKKDNPLNKLNKHKLFYEGDCIVLIFLIYSGVSKTLSQTSSHPQISFGSQSSRKHHELMRAF